MCSSFNKACLRLDVLRRMRRRRWRRRGRSRRGRWRKWDDSRGTTSPDRLN
jgi:hypothetical protein